jgi:hypothetical protein
VDLAELLLWDETHNTSIQIITALKGFVLTLTNSSMIAKKKVKIKNISNWFVTLKLT